jgi:hypothetical protein
VTFVTCVTRRRLNRITGHFDTDVVVRPVTLCVIFHNINYAPGVDDSIQWQPRHKRAYSACLTPYLEGSDYGTRSIVQEPLAQIQYQGIPYLHSKLLYSVLKKHVALDLLEIEEPSFKSYNNQYPTLPPLRGRPFRMTGVTGR